MRLNEAKTAVIDDFRTRHEECRYIVHLEYIPFMYHAHFAYISIEVMASLDLCAPHSFFWLYRGNEYRLKVQSFAYLGQVVQSYYVELHLVKDTNYN